MEELFMTINFITNDSWPNYIGLTTDISGSASASPVNLNPGKVLYASGSSPAWYIVTIDKYLVPFVLPKLQS
jgi:hypothetical protein